jgi:hypothetical protein
MGQERDCTLRYGGREETGKAYLETDYLLFRGERRLKVPFQDLTSVKVDGNVLILEFAGGPAVIELDAAAVRWAQKILHPPSRLEKLAIKPGTRLHVIGELEPAFLAEAEKGGAILARTAADLVFLAAEKSGDLRRIARLAAGLPAGSALWVVFPKGVAAIREAEVIAAGRAAGLKDTKVARFSTSHTALRFIRVKTG